MKAGELLKQLTVNPFHEDYTGIFTQMGSTIIPLTTAKPDDEGNLIFFRQNRKAPMSTKTLFSILLLHKKNIFCWNNHKIAIYSFRIDHGKIIV
ncbi:hypothetical protein [Enterococcus malodoratus]|uniref:Uncharacterized protein n=1 Tax=Enterococcus malodoratus ATCC 43197 TaxID=1158601 RepID=R2QUC8_9ENTE|nr:hypothetical protein [Enterococcus malodoratus]EOH75110.1 hypothetical protein UAI_03351 [Enterococcus malodoratus ATCC 43197]EOT67012.1 hypothetical protein I585_02533 [Enterococcus malodoratus ATCC 43197]SET93280.1 hypothetical protein SAMN04487821_13025 [Enterococcus malodoratus]SPX03864.1 Uncharacterised protein [Enterococcus malodoratus]STD69736.1 Uncharacterised protein [Enterococcus malodoratus]